MAEKPDRPDPATAVAPTPLDLRLHRERPAVTRLSRKILIGLAGGSALAITGLLGYALQPRDRRDDARQELLGSPAPLAAEGLSGLAKDYTKPPPLLGPPLPGDLGKPILNAHPYGRPAPDQAAQRLTQEVEAARVSRLFAQITRQDRNAPGGISTVAGDAGTIGSNHPPQDDKSSFLTSSTDRRTVNPDRLTKPVSPYVLQAGAVIPAALITGIQSDLPGQITAQVTENVYDSPTGRYRLIPQGAKLIGEYDSSIAAGQSRVLLVWTRLIMPGGTTLVLGRQPGADPAGYAGLADGVDYHWGALFKDALLSTVLSVGAEAGSSGQDGAIVRALRQGTANSVSQTGQQIVQRQLDIPPTLTLRPGLPLRVLVTRDLILAPTEE